MGYPGQSTLPSSCPVCEHSPVSGADCTIYKSLRTTIRVFLKTEEKKREAARPKTSTSTPTTPLETTQTQHQPQGLTEVVPVDAAPSTGSAHAEITLEHPPAVSGQDATEDGPVAPDQASALPMTQVSPGQGMALLKSLGSNNTPRRMNRSNRPATSPCKVKKRLPTNTPKPTSFLR